MKLKLWHLLGAVILTAWAMQAQTPPVSLISAPTGSSLTNCGTPSTPSLCIVSTGVYVWTNATAGWVQIGITTVAGVTSIAVCNAAGASCGTPQTGAVSLSIPTKASETATITLQ